VIAVLGFLIMLAQVAIAMRGFRFHELGRSSWLSPNRREVIVGHLRAFDREYNGDLRIAKWILLVTPVVHTVGLFLSNVDIFVGIVFLFIIVQCWALTYIYLDFIEWSSGTLEEFNRLQYVRMSARIWGLAALGAFAILWFVPLPSPRYAMVVLQSIGILVSCAVVLMSSLWSALKRRWQQHEDD
jgi:hypothetical protein